MELQVSSSYLGIVYRIDEFTKAVDRTVQRALEIREKHPYDAIAFTGNSGAAMAHILSYRMGVPLICVRKENENSHYVKENRRYLEGFLGAKNYLIVDDFISSGDTVARIIKVIAEKMRDAKCAAILLYKADYKRNQLHYDIPTYGSYREY